MARVRRRARARVYAGYGLLFARVFHGVDGVGLRRSLEITLAGVAATRLLATAGRGAWC